MRKIIQEKITASIPKLNKSTFILLGLYLLLETIQLLHNQQKLVIPQVVYANISFITLVIITFLVINIILKLSLPVLIHKDLEVEERIFYSKVYIWGAYILGFAFILYNLGVSLSNLTLIVGLAASGLAFAVRDVLLSIISWLILLRKKPFRIGDYIRIGDDEGEVRHIGTFHVILDKTPDTRDDFTRVPNKTFLEKSIHNFGRETLLEVLKLKLKKAPSQKDLTSIRESLEKVLSHNGEILGEQIVFKLDITDGNPLLIVEYIVKQKHRFTLKTKFVQILFETTKKLRK
jgi:MscS family membrane protein